MINDKKSLLSVAGGAIFAIENRKDVKLLKTIKLCYHRKCRVL